MFDNLRDQADAAPPEDAGTVGPVVNFDKVRAGAASPAPRFLGMTAPQRLVIAVLLMLSVCVVGAMCLLATGRIGAF